MLHSDAIKRNLPRTSYNINEITIDVIAEVQKDLTAYDLASLVFLLYDVPDTALQRLTLLQRVARDVRREDLDLLYDWAIHRKKDPTWRQEFLEALVICQLYGVIRKLGFDVDTVKKTYSKPNPLDTDYIHPMKKALYNLCENLNSDNLLKLKLTLGTYNVNVNEYDSCELILLQLMCQKFITVDLRECSVQKLTTIIENIPGLLDSAKQLRETELTLNRERLVLQTPAASSYHSTTEPKIQPLNVTSESKTKLIESVIEAFDGNFEETFENLADLVEKNLTITNLKTDAAKLSADAYEIKNPKRIGVCCIINQENFHPSIESISNKTCNEPLADRKGSTQDKLSLAWNMKKLNFHVEATDDVEHQNIMPFIKDIIQNKVQADDSMFVLCILSHGIEGHVYGVDSVPVKVQDIQDLLDSEDARILRGKPKVLIIQACQVTRERPALKLVADGPIKPKSDGHKTSKYFLRKSDFLICWATAPEYAAWRDDKKGSVFIQILCSIIYKRAKHEHIFDMFTKITDTVAEICAQNNCAQIPEVKTTLRKKLYLCVPKTT